MSLSVCGSSTLCLSGLCPFGLLVFWVVFSKFSTMVNGRMKADNFIELVFVLICRIVLNIKGVFILG